MISLLTVVFIPSVSNSEGYAIQIKEFHQYEVPIDPYNEFEKFIPPQSYKYIED